MLDDLTLFLEIARRGSFARTAEDLALSPSALSKRISSLEKQLGGALMTRSSRGVVLTAFGKTVYEDVAQSIAAVQQKIRSYDGARQANLSILCPQNLMVGPLFGVLSRFHFAHPSLQLNIEPSNRNALTSQKQFDVALRVGEQQDSSLYQKRVGAIAVHIVGRRSRDQTSHLYVPYGKRQLADMAAYRNAIASYQYESFVGDITLVRKLVAADNGAGLLPATEIQQLVNSDVAGLQYHSGILFTRPIYALWPNSPSPGALAEEFVRQVGEYCAETLSLSGKVIPLN